MSHKHTRAPGAASALDLPPARPANRRIALIGLALLSAAAIAYGIYTSQSGLTRAPHAPAAAVASSAASSLASFRPIHDFGGISMAAGKVGHTYTVMNTGGAPVTIVGVQTSCMCTAANVVTANGRFGPFGMAGHGGMPAIREAVAPGGSAQIEVVFDAAAHGPAGVGRTERVVTIETDRGAALELRLVALVRP